MGELGEEVEQVAIGLNAVHPATADQDVEACLGPATLTVACVDFRAAVHSGQRMAFAIKLDSM